MLHRERCEIATQLPTHTGIRFRVFRVAASGDRKRQREGGREGEQRRKNCRCKLTNVPGCGCGCEAVGIFRPKGLTGNQVTRSTRRTGYGVFHTGWF